MATVRAASRRLRNDRQSPSIRVDERQLFWGKREDPFGIVKFRRIEQEERIPRGRLAQLLSCQREQAELIASVDAREDRLPFSKSYSEATPPRL